ncbi:hypothetical protein D9Y22_21785, partial [Methylorubrum sp. DB1722]|nr:hypothetical protein [Methylorubrum sp. DB1722]
MMGTSRQTGAQDHSLLGEALAGSRRTRNERPADRWSASISKWPVSRPAIMTSQTLRPPRRRVP